jgi:glutamate/tyrosine decarboxylase-like PLP-dependent enzyme
VDHWSTAAAQLDLPEKAQSGEDEAMTAETREALRAAMEAEIGPVLRITGAAARNYLAELPQLPAKQRGAVQSARFDADLPEAGVGAEAAVKWLAEYVRGAAVHVDGPRFFHLVAGGSTPAALGGDMLCSVFDQHAFASMSSPAAVRLEQAMIGWLKDLFDLPAEFGGAMVTGGTMANFTSLAAARQWCARQSGVDAAQTGVSAMRPLQILSSGFVHASIAKAASMLGVGRQNVRSFAADASGELDPGALETALERLDGAPCVIVANAGEVNAGAFDPIDLMADLAKKYGCWLHVDGTFGLFARLSPALKPLTAGVERADSVTADGHKWLNVPFDTGFCFVRDEQLLSEVFSLDGAYLNDDPDAAGMLGLRGPEMSRRARAFPVFATLAAYGREGYRELVENGVGLAQELARLVEEANDFELLAPAQLCITSFRYTPEEVDEAQLDQLNARIGEAVLADGQIYMGTTVSRGRVAFKPAFVNWRTSSGEITIILPILRGLGQEIMRRDAA